MTLQGSRLVIVALLFGFSSVLVAAGFEAKVSGSLVQIYTFTQNPEKGHGSGTGFVINSQGYIGTNNHVITERGHVIDRIYINPEGHTVNVMQSYKAPNATVIWNSAGLDLAILKLDDMPSNMHGMTFTSTLPERNENVTAIGYPGAANNNEFRGVDRISNATFTKGVLSRSYQGTWGAVPITVVQHSAETSWGNSGGPLVDQCGRIIGVNTRISLDGKIFTAKGEVIARTQVSGVHYASQITELMRELDRRDIAYDASSEKCDIQGDLIDILKTIVLVGGIGFFILGALIVVFLRKPRQQFVHAIENVSRRFSHQEQSSPEQKARKDASMVIPTLILDGRDSGTGKRYRIIISDHDLSQGSAIIGRDPDSAQILVDHPEISRAHATISWRNGAFRISDNNSTNGTTLNSKALSSGQPYEIRNGDKLGLGTLDLRAIIS